MTVTTALYRRYRPDSFADVIGQEHVTEPLMTALRKNRVNHAYLFSGPRGCGKTTSARILARCLNCAEGPTDTPCGKCPSCIELARGGSGSLDVLEIDAASHGGVDDARDLRERATYAPVRDRYKIFIIDEAHMVSPAGFNALLKIVEEPPEHIKFIFATTEPDKVIGTIKSRTHHYPFRLVPPEPLMAYLELLCRQENVPVAPGVLSLVIRAGSGSVRDSLSVLDQLIAGAGQTGLDYELAVALLGYTHASLLDDVVEAVAASDAATVFRAVDRVIQTGHDPRRFVEDLLERFRDLIVVQAMPESAQSILRGTPADQVERMRIQAHNLGAAELSRAADITNTALTEMTGATSPRLHLELLCARILLPSAEQAERGIAARIDRVERRLNYAGNDVGAPVPVPSAGTPGSAAPAPVTSAGAPLPAAGSVPAAVPAPSAEELVREPLTAPRVSRGDGPTDEQAARRAPSGQVPAAQPPAPVQAVPPVPAAPMRPTPAEPPRSAPAQSQPAAAATAPGPGADVEVLRRAWPDILQALTKIKRSTWALVEPNAQVSDFDGQVLTLSFTTAGLAGAFGRADHSENLRQAIHKAIGIECQINGVTAGANRPGSGSNPKVPASPDTPVTSADAEWGLTPASAPSAPTAGRPAGSAAAPAPASPAPAPSTPQSPVPAAARPEVVPAPAATSAAEPTGSADPQDFAGSYAPADDDWGPPLDEDAPPLDEEPPMDWNPPAPEWSAPATVSKTAVASEAAPRRAPGLPSMSGGPAAPAAQEASNDLWARAVEQSPGVWTVDTGTTTTHHGPSDPVAESGHTLGPQHYAPAAAQIPAGPADPPAPEDAAGPAGQPQPAPFATAVTAVTAAPVAVAVAAPAPVPLQAAAPPSNSRQSLYQRLSNSPEAEAGRAKGPVRAAAGTAATMQDIPSADDETIEESGVFGRAAVERILGGKLVEERALDGSPLPPRS